MRALVVGAGGFLGSNLCAALTRQGVTVRGVGRSLHHRGPLDGVEFVRREVSLGPIEDLFRGIDVVFHLAGPATPYGLEADTESARGGFHHETPAILRAGHAAGIRRIVFASSGGTVYGDHGGLPVGETAQARPISAYGAHKLAAEAELMRYNRDHAMTNIVLRIANAFGPYQRGGGQQGVVSIFGQAILSDRPVTLIGNGAGRRDFVYVDDVSDAFVAAARYGGAERVFNVGSGHDRSILDVLHAVESAVGRKATVRHAPARTFDLPSSVLDTSRARTELGWRSRIPWSEGIDRTVEWLRSERTG